MVGEVAILGTSDAEPAVKLRSISEPVETNTGDSLSNPAVILDERKPDETTEPRHGANDYLRIDIQFSLY